MATEVSSRLYEIRCRIVHAKVADDAVEAEPLLPYTSEEQNLTEDVALMKFIAAKVIAAGGNSLVL